MKDLGFSTKDLSIGIPTTTIEGQEITTANVAADADWLRELVNEAVDWQCECETKRKSPAAFKVRLDALVDKITLGKARGEWNPKVSDEAHAFHQESLRHAEEGRAALDEMLRCLGKVYLE